MALTLTAASQDIDGAGPHTWALDSGSNAGAIVVGIAQSSRDPNVSAIDYGGKALTKRSEGSWSVGGHQRGEVWAYIGNDIPTGSNTVTVTVATGEDRSACAYALTAGGPIAILSTQNKSTASGNVSFTSDSGIKSGISIVAGSVKQIGGSVQAGTTADIYRNPVDKTFTIARDTTASTGSRTTGTTNTWLCGAAQALFVEDEVVMSPDSFGTELGFTTSPNIVISSDMVMLPQTSFGTEIGFFPGIGITKPRTRQVALVGEGVDLTEMTEGGTEGQVLTKHAKLKPSWEDAAGGGGASGVDRWVPMTIDDSGWQLLFTDGGDVTMMRVVDESIWDEAGDLIPADSGGLGDMGLGEDGLGE